MAKKISRIKEEIAGIVAVLSSVYLGLSLASYSKWDSSFFTYSASPVRNYGGVIGAYAADLLMSSIGFAAYLMPAALVAYGIRRLLGREKKTVYLLGTLLLLFAVSLLSALLLKTFHLSAENNPGGIAGSVTAGLLVRYLSVLGAYLLALSCFFSSLVLLIPIAITPSLFARKKKEEPKKKGILEDDILITEPEELFEPEIIEPVHSIEPDPEPEPRQKSRPAETGPFKRRLYPAFVRAAV